MQSIRQKTWRRPGSASTDPTTKVRHRSGQIKMGVSHDRRFQEETPVLSGALATFLYAEAMTMRWKVHSQRDLPQLEAVACTLVQYTLSGCCLSQRSAPSTCLAESLIELRNQRDQSSFTLLCREMRSSCQREDDVFRKHQ